MIRRALLGLTAVAIGGYILGVLVGLVLWPSLGEDVFAVIGSVAFASAVVVAPPFSRWVVHGRAQR